MVDSNWIFLNHNRVLAYLQGTTEKHWGQYVVIDVNDCKNYGSIEGRDQRLWKESNILFNKGLMISSYNKKLSHCILSNNFTGVDKIWIGPDRSTDWITDQNKKFWKMKNSNRL